MRHHLRVVRRIGTATLVAFTAIAFGNLTACGHYVGMRAPGPNECLFTTASFREAQGGIGKEYVESEVGNEAYARCPEPATVPADILTAYRKGHAGMPDGAAGGFKKTAVPVGFKLLEEATRPVNGVLYKYSKYDIAFRGCDAERTCTTQ